MTLKVIGAGWPRTGTLTAWTVLKEWGFTPYHSAVMAEDWDADVDRWLQFRDGAPSSALRRLASFDAVLDFPACVFWKDLWALNPGAKILLTTRPSDSWFESFDSTLRMETIVGVPDTFRSELLWKGLLKGASTKDEAIKAYETHVADVRNTVSAEALIEWDVRAGWGSFPKRLGFATPTTPPPWTNIRPPQAAQFVEPAVDELAMALRDVKKIKKDGVTFSFRSWSTDHWEGRDYLKVTIMATDQDGRVLPGLSNPYLYWGLTVNEDEVTESAVDFIAEQVLVKARLEGWTG